MRISVRVNYGILLILNLFAIFYFYYQSTNKCIQTSESFDNNKTSLDELKNFDEIFTCSDEQHFIDKSIILKAISFMLQETNEFDPNLIEFVRSQIRKPSKERKLNLTQPNRKDFSQIGQSKWVDNVLERKRNGFFVEAGGYDGEEFSVKHFFFQNLFQ